jgi:5'-3' exonuclease
MTQFILIDGSYYIFYRFYALQIWWKNARPEEQLDKPHENKEFMEKFRSTCVSKIAEISKKLKIKNPVIIVGADCPRKEIWRMKYFPEYKAHRTTDDTFMVGPFFKAAYKDDLFLEGGAHHILMHPHLEADDCIALTTKHILEKYDDAEITIITSDMDYLQLIEERVKIYNLKYKALIDSKNWSGNAEKDLFMKIVMGDKSDGIPSVLKKCGPKTAEKCFNDKEYFQKRMIEEDAYEIFERNRKIIDFNEIPEDLVDNFKKTTLGL